MNTTHSIPLQIDPEAAAHITGHGLQAAFDEMIEHTRQTVPGLQAIHVMLQPPYDLGGGDCILIEVLRDHPQTDYDPTDREWGLWRVSHFPPEVFQHFVLYSAYENNHAG